MKQLYIPEDATPEVKEMLEASQQALFNIQEFKGKADSGTLTFSDLEILTQRQLALTAVFAKGEPAAVGLSTGPATMDDLEALARKRMDESFALVEQSGGPAYKVNSLEELQALAALPPEAAAEKVLAAVKKNQKPDEKAENQTAEKIPKKVPLPKTKIEIKEEKRRQKDLDEIVRLLTLCKDSFFDLTLEWSLLATFEELFVVHLDGLKEENDTLFEFLSGFITDESEADKIVEKQPAAAFALASIDDGEARHLKFLWQMMQEKEQLRKMISKAFRYGLRTDINRFLDTLLPLSNPETQAEIIAILHYRGKVVLHQSQPSLKTEIPELRSALLAVYSKEKIPITTLLTTDAFNSNKTSIPECDLLSWMLAGHYEGIQSIRKELSRHSEAAKDLPLFLALGGNGNDIDLIERQLDVPASKQSAIQALGILGLRMHVPLLIERLGKEEWEMQRVIVDSLEMITGAGLELPIPEIKEGPEGKEYEITVNTGWRPIWARWWHTNQNRFQNRYRYRRGNAFTLGSCIDEMANPKGNWWSRQYSYYELRIRSGAYVCHFEADWYVADQLRSIAQWQDWWQQKRIRFGDAQWLFAGTL